MEPEYFLNNPVWQLVNSTKSLNPQDPNHNIRVFLRQEHGQGRISDQQYTLLMLKYSQ